ncbi:DUF3443 domain-containing protein [Paraburkholderia sp.]|uniref:DUF3443 domain-containing protein n=1 Tax=Paraburkholderia sp. TaxID=1926495 RepID=UPI00286FAA34|nr:DUF3443 domain-containing protein [Paraburkholderia sp.]
MFTIGFSNLIPRALHVLDALRALRTLSAGPALARGGLLAACFALSAGLAACGGGGGSDSSSSSSNSASDTSKLPAGPTQQPIAVGAANTVGVTVNAGVTGNMPNIPTISVTLCVAGTSTCQTISNVQVDTASYGLRIAASALNSTMTGALPLTTASGGTLAECTAFADGYTWGTVRNADVKIGGETASNIPVQVVGDLSTSSVPQACASYGAAQNSPQELGANGLIGIGVAPWDCGSRCATNVNNTSSYYSCPNGSNCSTVAVATGAQVANPVAHFATDNNGVILQMQPVSLNGQASATGTLVFGIGTQSNNTMSASQTFATDQWGDVVGSYKGRSLAAFLDSGSNGLFFNDSSIGQCGGNLGTFYCPSTPLALSATLTDLNNKTATVNFNVVSAQVLLGNGTNYVANDLGGEFGSNANLDLGLPFFYGRYVYYGFDKTATGGTQTPYFAF